MPLAGSAPFGYDRINSKLIVNESEAQQVRIIFLKYLQFGTVKALARHLNKQGILTKSKNLKNGSTRGGGKFYVSSVRYILRNRFYIGEVVVEDGTVKGAHMPVLDRELFDAVQYRLDMQRWGLNMGTATAMGITHRKNQLLLGNPMK